MSRLPTLRPRQLIAALKKAGFAQHHQRGSHPILRHPDGHQTVAPMHAGDLPRGTTISISSQVDITGDELAELP